MSPQNEAAEERVGSPGDKSFEAGAAAFFEGVASYAEGTIHTLADNMAELLGGGPTPPAAAPRPSNGEDQRHQECLDEVRAAQQAEASEQGPENASDEKGATPSRGRG